MAWKHLRERSRRKEDLTQALIAEVQRGSARRQKGRAACAPFSGEELARFSRKKLEPMVCGLFPRVEREPVLSVLERSVVFLTDENIETIFREGSWLHTSWTLANF